MKSLAIISIGLMTLNACSSRDDDKNNQIKASCDLGLPCGVPAEAGVFTLQPDPSFLPKDPEFINQANLQSTTNPDAPSKYRTGILEMWRANPRVPTSYVMGSTAILDPEINSRSSLSQRSVKIAILDTGLVPDSLVIPDLENKIYAEYDYIDVEEVAGDGDGRDGNAERISKTPSCPTVSTAAVVKSAAPYNDHGVSMMSIAAASINGQGMVGVSPASELIVFRAISGTICDSYMLYADTPDSVINSAPSVLKEAMLRRKQKGLILWKGIVDAINDAVKDGAKVINLSIGIPLLDFSDPSKSPALINACSRVPGLQTAIDNAYNNNVAVVVAAGDSSADPETLIPASCNNVIIANNTDLKGQGYSTSSPFLDQSRLASHNSLLVGVDTEGSRMIRVRDTGTSYYFSSDHGSSIATATLSGVIANLFSLDPTLKITQVRNLIWNTGVLAKESVGDPATYLVINSLGKLTKNTKSTKYVADIILDAKRLAEVAGSFDSDSNYLRNNWILRVPAGGGGY